MKRGYLLLLFLFVILLVNSCSGIQFSQIQIPETFSTETSSILVKVNDANGKSASDLASTFKNQDSSLAKINSAKFVFPNINSDDLSKWVVITVDKNTNLNLEVQKYMKLSNVEYAEVDYETNFLDNYSNISMSPVIPTDLNFSQQWYLHNTGQFGLNDADIDAPEAWEIENGSSDVIIAIVDSGVDYLHYDLQGKIWENDDPFNSVDDDNNGYVDDTNGWNFVSLNRDTYDNYGRGTQIAGIIGARSNDSPQIIHASKIRLNVTGMPKIPYLNYLLINEIQVYDNDLVNVALNQEVSSYPVAVSGHPDELLNDGIITSSNYWQVNFPDGSDHNKAWVEMNLPSLIELKKIVITSLGALGPINYTIEYLDGDSHWNVLYNVLNNYDAVITHEISYGGGDSISGVCWNCKIMPIKISEDGSFTSQNVGLGIVYAANSSADIINLGFYGEPFSQFEQDAINYAYTSGSIIVAPAGENSVSKVYPGAYENVVAVSALDNYNRRNYRANYNDNKDKWIDMSSYGISIFTLNKNGGIIYSGSTFTSSAIVSGVLGLVKSYNPGLSSNQIIGRVLSTGDNIDYNDSSVYLDNETILGSGRVNAFNALSIVPNNNLIFQNYTINDSLGNNDGNLNPGETINLKVRLRSNYGDINNINSVLTSSSSDVIITSPNYNYGNFQTMQSKVGSFSFTLNNNPALYNTFVNFTLTINGDEYSDTIPFRVYITNRVKAGWPITTPYGDFVRRTLVGDVNADGSLEIVVIANDYLYIYSKSGVLINSWLLDTTGFYSPSNSVALVNLDRDAKLEIIVPMVDNEDFSGKIMVYKPDGSLLSGWPVYLQDIGSINGLVVGDVDNDGSSEIFVNNIFYGGPPNSQIYSFNSDGTALSGFGVKQFDEKIVSELSIGDVDGDNNLEIFAIDDQPNLYSWEYDGSNVTGFPVNNVGTYATNLDPGNVILSDVDKDSRLDIIVNSGKASFLDKNGNIIWSNYLGYVEYWYSSTAVGDFDNNGFFDLAFSSRVYDYYLEEGMIVRVYDKDGVSINSCWDSFSMNGGHYKIYSADVDGDSISEIILAGYSSYPYQYKILAYNSDCSMVSGFPIIGSVGDSPSFVDLDKNNKLDLVTFNFNTVIVYDLYTSYNKNKNNWPMHMHDVQNTGNTKFCDCFSGYICKPNGLCVKPVKPGPIPVIDPGNMRV